MTTSLILVVENHFDVPFLRLKMMREDSER